MYLEKRRIGKSTKYYLVYSYREKDKVKKIRRYLGSNLFLKELEKARIEAEQQIKKEIRELSTEIFNFSLSKKQIERLNEYDKKLEVYHFDKKDWKRFTEEFVYNTNAIEGSSVQLGEVKEILAEYKTAKEPEEIETKGVAKAINYIRKTKEDLSLALIRRLHRLCFEGSKPFAGQFRNVEVVIMNARREIVHTGVPLSQLDFALKEMMLWHKKNKNKFKPLVLAVIIHNQFEHIHPFQDGNGRIGRLLLNFILLKNNYPPINILLEDRAEYYQSLQEYHKNQDLKPTLKFLIKQYQKMLRKVTTKIKAN